MPNVIDHNLTLEELDRQTVFHPSTHLKDHAHGVSGGPRIITSGKGIRIEDTKGNSLIDGFAGLYCVNVGYGRMEIADAIHEQARKLAYYHTYVGHSNEPTIRLSERIIRMAPQGMSKVYYGMSGSDANETQVKLVWYFNNVLGRRGKKKIISRHRGYHGSGIMSGSLTGLPLFHEAFDLPLPQVKHTVTPHYYWGAEPGMSEREFSAWCAQELERMILDEGPDTVAAFIAEPVMGTGGIIPPPEGYWEAIQGVLSKYDVLLIADEVVTGFGRIGADFGSYVYGIQPDLMTLAKGITSGYFPLSAVIVSENVWRVLEEGAEKMGPIGHGWTYSAHALGAAAAMANLDIVERERLADNARETGTYFQQRLHETFDERPLVGEVRGVSLLAALEFVADREKKQRFEASAKVGARVAAACLENGLIARPLPHGDILGFAPPLVVTREEVDDIVERTRRAVDKVTEELVREGKLKAA
ncbi:MAG: aminotransferase class III-fold pyridoxal phosphate-dependent enzyme [Gammaproteobacteria bacterium]|nr:aminotransferase class III-fold pyridoxal phosphate-dependent enzyme [Gammaproteobacteria bacterium]NIR82949.1 aminotransferase class III-fold pyridoxal phosphate-dependent enzyme [Gammaproteobacteria bacterium]NIR90314.1 aminotransferase class III-fold pyridoxal phosphate-dependent enzyme [Gammaproteobacteria bacterium]NIU04095.1 aminotransferase class III-fold pyridoxal phosphate-dependent enzyme [Gammaproteobacteria bacterium]NIV51391.1 aminotransferase class III-fold pyridoxal phosphate-